MDWFYIDADQERQRFEETALGDLVREGTITGATKLWNETMSDWRAAESLFPAWFSDKPPGEAGKPEKKPTGPMVAAVEETQTIPEKKTPAIGVVRSEGRPAAPGTNQRETIKDFASYLNANRGWIKFYGILSILNGALLCMTIVGALVGWLPIWLGVNVFRSARAAQFAERTGNVEDMEEALYRLGFFFRLRGIAVVVVVLFIAAVVVAAYLFGVLAWFQNRIQPAG